MGNEKNDLVRIQSLFSQNQLSAVALLQQYLDRIKQLDSNLRAFIEIEEKEALCDARASDERRKNGILLSEFDGIPIGIKDNIVQDGRVTTCASRILANYRSPFSATVIKKLREKGFIPMGRLNMDEFAMGSSTENSSNQTTKNPFDPSLAPGGSSGGSACAVAANMIPVALGSDTGGSIRQPASFCGVVGLKPTYGLVSRYGLVAFGSSLDQIGPIGKTVNDCQIIYECIKGHDPNDATSILEHKIKEPPHKKPEEIKIAYPKNLLEKCDPKVKSSFMQVLSYLEKEVLQKSEPLEIEMPYQDYAIPSYYITATSEASSNLARFDGIRYGHREKGADLDEVYLNSKTKRFGKEVKRRILLGTFALSSGYYDAYYAKAQKVRELMRLSYQETFKKIDIILLPTTPTEPFQLGEKTSNPVDMYLSDELTVTASLAGIPALSLPSPFDDLPIGVQIQGAWFSENIIFSLAKKIEKKFPANQPSL